VSSELVAAIAIGGILLAAKLGEDGAGRLRLPSFIGALIAGVIIGPAGLGFISEDVVGEIGLLLSIGINFTLFLAGVEELSNPLLLKPSRREVLQAFYVFFPGMVSTAIAVFYILRDMYTSILFASAVSLTSLGPLTKILLESAHGISARALQALRVGLVVELLGIMVYNSLYHGLTVYSLLATVVFVVGVAVLGRTYMDRALRFTERVLAIREAPFAIIVALILLAGYLAELIGFNAAITALLLGVFASNYLHERPAYLERIRAFTYGFLEPLFFAGIGLYAARPDLYSTLYVLLLALILPPRILVSLSLDFPLRESLVLGAKGGIDAAMLLALLLEGRIDSSLYTAGVFTVLSSTLLAASSVRTLGAKPELWRMKIGEIVLGHDAVYYKERASYAAKLLAGRGALIVVGEKYRPVGYIMAEDLIGLPADLLETIPVSLFARTEVPIVREDWLVADLVADQSLIHEPIIAVVDSEGRLVGTLKPQQILALVG